MEKNTPPGWLVVGSVLVCMFVVEYYRALNTRTDIVTYYYPGQAALLNALAENHGALKVTVFFGFEALRGLDP